MSKDFRKKWMDRQTQAPRDRPQAPLSGQLARADELRRAGRTEEAIAHYRQHAERSPDDFRGHEGLGVVLAQAGRVAEARSSLETALSLSPGALQASLVLAQMHAGQGDAESAARILRSACDAHQDDPRALVAIGDALLATGHPAVAESALTRAASLAPRDAQVQFKRALALQMMRRNDEAVKGYRATLALQPNVGPAFANIGAIYAESGRYEEARNQYALAASAGGPSRSGFLFRRALLCPVILTGAGQIDELRETMAYEVDELKAKGARLQDPHHEVGTANFYWTYQGRPDAALQAKIADAYLTACPELAWTSPFLGALPRRDRLKVGFCSAFFRDHTVGRVFEGLIASLDRQKFEVAVFTTTPPGDEVARRIARSADRFVPLPGTLRQARSAIADEKLDILVHADVGMDSFTYFLAFARLAPVQCVGWGHPDTTGIPNMDYYLSSASFEPERGPDHYTERLVRLPRISCRLNRPAQSAAPFGREGFGFGADERVYLCAQSLFKFHPDFDAALAAILRKDPNGRAVFFETSEPNWVKLLKARLARSVPDVADRICFLPRLEPQRFLGALLAADAVIDSKHFTGGHTAYLAFAAGVPVVTWNGELMRGRMTSGLYRQMGLEGMVAEDDAEFSDLSVRLATDRPFRDDWRARVRSSSDRLFDDLGSVRDFEEFLVAAAKADASPPFCG